MKRIALAALAAVIYTLVTACGGGSDTTGPMMGTDNQGTTPTDTGDATDPTASDNMPMDMAPTLAEPALGNDGVHLSWTAIPNAMEYGVLRLGEMIARMQTLGWIDLDPPLGEVVYQVVPFDKKGTRGKPSNEVRVVIAPADPCADYDRSLDGEWNCCGEVGRCRYFTCSATAPLGKCGLDCEAFGADFDDMEMNPDGGFTIKLEMPDRTITCRR